MQTISADLPADESETKRPPPTLSFREITFSDGTTLSVEPDDIVVFVGPNNAGKSAALRELELQVARRQSGSVVISSSMYREGTSAELREYLEENAQKSGDLANVTYGGIGYSIHQSHIDWFNRDDDRHPVASFFAKRLATETRIQDANAAPGVALFVDPPTHPIHLLLMDEALAQSISEKFKRAFGRDLTVFRAGGTSFPLMVGTKPTVPAGQDELSKQFVMDLLKTNVRLDQQGDGMRSFAAVMLHVLAPQTHSIQFLDEPEAFLHPPQARLLGRYIAEGRSSKSQLFIATHSTDILDGLIEGGSNKVRIIRIRRDGNVNHVRELNREMTRAVANDTLIRFSRVFDGIFFEHVIVCESDADCMLYQSTLELPCISGDRKPDVLFVHSAGKHRMAKMAATLKALDVPVSVIADIDVLNDGGTLRNLVEKLGGDWSGIQPFWKAVYDSVVATRPPLNAAQVSGLIAEELDGVADTGEFPKAKENAIKRVFKTVSPWSALKLSGRGALPGGEPTRQFDQLVTALQKIGLWIVPVGELEGFCKSIGSHGPGYVERVLEERSLETDEELADLRSFIGKIWSARRTETDIEPAAKPLGDIEQEPL